MRKSIRVGLRDRAPSSHRGSGRGRRETGAPAEDGTRELWRNVFGGPASSRFHRVSNPENPSGLGLSSLARTHLRAARSLSEEMDVFRAAPRRELLARRSPDEAYVMGSGRLEYAIYFPDGGSVELELTMASEQLSMRWLDILGGEGSAVDCKETRG